MKLTKTVAVALLAGATLTASSAAGAPTTATPPAPARNAHLTVWSVDSDGPYFNALVTGAVGDHGQAVAVHPDGSVDPDHSSQLELRLADGSFRLSLAPFAAKLATILRDWAPDPATCSGGIRFTVPAPVVAGSGTRAYRDIGGGFSVTVHLDEVIPDPPCVNVVAPLAELIVLDADGTLRSPS